VVKLFKRRRPEPPEWASFFDADEWEAFCVAVERDVGGRGWSPDFEEGLVHGGPEGGMYGLGNIAQMCHGAPREEWADLIRDHFTTIAAAEPTAFSGPEEARAAIKARLVDDDFMPGWEYAERRVAEDLRLVLAYDLPTTVTIPPREEILEWGSEDELFEIAIEHVRAEPGLELGTHEFPSPDGATRIWTLLGESFFTATHALWAETFDPPPSEHGTLVAVPNRHSVLAHPIRDLGTVSAVTHLVDLGHRLWVEGPGSLSDGVYWLREGRLERLDIVREDENTRFTPSEAFLDVLNRLG
jgi:hypothetical protein